MGGSWYLQPVEKYISEEKTNGVELVNWIMRNQIWEHLGSEDSRQREQLVEQSEVEKRLRCVIGSKGN